MPLEIENLTAKIRILAVDDDPNVTWILSDGLSESEFVVECCNDSQSALAKLATFRPDLCLIDIKMPGMDGIELLNHIKKYDPSISVIIISGHADTPIVVQAVKGGAEDFIVKPFDVEMVEICIQKVMEKKSLRQRVRSLESELARQSLWSHFVGESPQIQHVRELIEQIGTTDLNVLIRGESGTGKDIVARMIHQISDRNRGPFVKVNCAALPPDLLESELFGHERGAFTGAYKSKPGRFELAEKGTIFLDEIGEMPPAIQATLLQVLEHKEFYRVGGTQTIKVNVRLICATNVNLEKMIQSKSFRLDLLYRINDITIHMPSLRERPEDICLLAHFFLNRYYEKFGKTPQPLSAESERLLMEYTWPGNVRELESLVKRVVIFGEQEIRHNIEKGRDDMLLPKEESPAGGDFNPAQLPDAYFEGKTLKDINDNVMGQIESRAIRLCLEHLGWNRKKAAKALGISYRCLLYKIQQYNLQKEPAAAR
ncbi:MAG: sigma-54 dependent transcriptional regulator [bacterium]|nr:sigma-54 dependent transcriptional regulator [bacterium]